MTRHSHSHGSHTHDHSHVAGDLAHEHGWHHPPERDEGDSVFGEEPDRPVHPTPDMPYRLYGEHRPGYPLVVVPYVPGMLRAETVGRLDAIGCEWLAVDVSGTEWDYWGLLRDVWADGEDLVIVEHDVVPHADFLDTFRECPHEWCGFSYWIEGRGCSVADYNPNNSERGTTTALGCIRIRGEVMREHPDLVEALPERSWPRLDYALTMALQVAGRRCCRHWPDVDHVETAPSETGQAIARRAMEAGAAQKQPELAGLVDWLAGHDVKVIVEVGADAGGTLAAWEALGCDTFAVSLPNAAYSSGRPLDAHGATVIEGDSHEAATLQRLLDALDGRQVDFVFIDGDHTYDGVASDFAMYGPLAPWVGFHDICNHPSLPEVQVRRLWNELEARHAVSFVSAPSTWGGIGVVRGLYG